MKRHFLVCGMAALLAVAGCSKDEERGEAGSETEAVVPALPADQARVVLARLHSKLKKCMADADEVGYFYDAMAEELEASNAYYDQVYALDPSLRRNYAQMQSDSVRATTDKYLFTIKVKARIAARSCRRLPETIEAVSIRFAPYSGVSSALNTCVDAARGAQKLDPSGDYDGTTWPGIKSSVVSCIPDLTRAATTLGLSLAEKEPAPQAQAAATTQPAASEAKDVAATGTEMGANDPGYADTTDAVATATQTVTGSGATQAATPRGRFGIITTDDYPDASLRANEQGRVTVAYTISETGRVEAGSCQITESSGFERLDHRTCELIERRFRFNPALANGVQVKEARTQSVTWAIPE